MRGCEHEGVGRNRRRMRGHRACGHRAQGNDHKGADCEDENFSGRGLLQTLAKLFLFGEAKERRWVGNLNKCRRTLGAR